MITVTDIRKTFGKTAAVKGVSFEVPNGSITALLGPNGAGKTTTIRSITGLVRPDTGRVDVDGIHVAAQPIAARARLGVVPEHIGVYDHLTVREHLEYSADLQGVPPGCGTPESNGCWNNSGSCRSHRDSRVRSRWVNAGVSPWLALWCTNPRISSSTNQPTAST